MGPRPEPLRLLYFLLGLGLVPLAWSLGAALALWTHVMTASAVIVTAAYLARRGRRFRALLPGLAALLLASAPLWWRALGEPDALRIVSVSGRRQTLGQHLAEVLPRLHEPVGGLLGTHVPLVPDDPSQTVQAPPWAAAGLILLYGGGLVMAGRRFRAHPAVALLMASAAVALAAFPLPLRSGPETIRFLTPVYLPLAALVAWVALAREHTRRAFILVLALCALHLVGARGVLAAW